MSKHKTVLEGIVEENTYQMNIKKISWEEVMMGGLNSCIRRNIPAHIQDIDHATYQPMAWSIPWLCERFGNVLVRVLYGTSQYFQYSDKKERSITQMTFGEFIQKGVRQPGSDGFYYALGRSPIKQFGGLESQMNLPSSLSWIENGTLRLPERNLWISTAGTRTALHFDAVDNLNFQIQGSKSFLLFPPRINGMHPYPYYTQAAYVSKVDPRRSSQLPEDFPIENAIECKLNEGECLYLPYGWWHQVDTVGSENVNVNYWWFPRHKLVTQYKQTFRGAMVLLNRMGKHPHERAEKMGSKT